MEFNDLLTLHEYDPERVRVLRHRPQEPELRRVLPWLAAERPELFNAYQQEAAGVRHVGLARRRGLEAGPLIRSQAAAGGLEPPFPVPAVVICYDHRHEEATMDDAWLEPKSPAEVDRILAELRSRLERIYGDRLRGIYVYGSYARGEPQRGSDLDVLVVLDRIDSHWEEIQRTSHDNADLSLEHDLTISTLFTTDEEWRASSTMFLRNVREEGRAA